MLILNFITCHSIKYIFVTMSVLLQQQDLLSRLRRYPSYWPIATPQSFQAA